MTLAVDEKHTRIYLGYARHTQHQPRQMLFSSSDLPKTVVTTLRPYYCRYLLIKYAA